MRCVPYQAMDLNIWSLVSGAVGEDDGTFGTRCYCEDLHHLGEGSKNTYSHPTSRSLSQLQMCGERYDLRAFLLRLPAYAPPIIMYSPLGSASSNKFFVLYVALEHAKNWKPWADHLKGHYPENQESIHLLWKVLHVKGRITEAKKKKEKKKEMGRDKRKMRQRETWETWCLNWVEGSTILWDRQNWEILMYPVWSRRSHIEFVPVLRNTCKVFKMWWVA